MPYRYLNRQEETPYFHVFARGNNKQSIYLSHPDYHRFLSKLQQYAIESDVPVLAYCLMRNHYHLLLQEIQPGAIARLMHRLNVSYAMYFNARYKRIGHLFQGPYGERSVASDEYLLQVSAYIHNNPLGIGANPETYPWSSYSDYLGGQNTWIQKNTVLSYFPDAAKVDSYRQFVASAQDLVLQEAKRPGLEAAVK
jgi:putative transposase